jgi:hypothetical protein
LDAVVPIRVDGIDVRHGCTKGRVPLRFVVWAGWEMEIAGEATLSMTGEAKMRVDMRISKKTWRQKL